MNTTESEIRELLSRRFGGVILTGGHSEDGECCILELESARRGLDWSDSPSDVRCFDIRPINDMTGIDPVIRTEGMVRLLAVYSGSLDWPIERQRAVVSRLVILTVQRIVAELPGIPEEIRQQCREAGDLSAAGAAARAVADAATYAVYAADDAVYAVACVADAAYTADAAYAAACTADAAVDAAVDAAADIFQRTVDLWVEAATSGCEYTE